MITTAFTKHGVQTVMRFYQDLTYDSRAFQDALNFRIENCGLRGLAPKLSDFIAQKLNLFSSNEPKS